MFNIYEYWHRVAKSLQPEWLERILNNTNILSVSVTQPLLTLEIQTLYILTVPLNVFHLELWLLSCLNSRYRRYFPANGKVRMSYKEPIYPNNPCEVLQDTSQHPIRQLGYQGESAASWALCNLFVCLFVFSNGSKRNWSHPCFRKQLKLYHTHIENSTQEILHTVLFFVSH